jgi:hypothetical protein
MFTTPKYTVRKRAIPPAAPHKIPSVATSSLFDDDEYVLALSNSTSTPSSAFYNQTQTQTARNLSNVFARVSVDDDEKKDRDIHASSSSYESNDSVQAAQDPALSLDDLEFERLFREMKPSAVASPAKKKKLTAKQRLSPDSNTERELDEHMSRFFDDFIRDYTDPVRSRHHVLVPNSRSSSTLLDSTSPPSSSFFETIPGTPSQPDEREEEEEDWGDSEEKGDEPMEQKIEFDFTDEHDSPASITQPLPELNETDVQSSLQLALSDTQQVTQPPLVSDIEDEPVPASFMDSLYHLHSVVMHHGDIEQGHYSTCSRVFVANKPYNRTSPVWKLNDMEVSASDLQTRDNASNVCLFIYLKQSEMERCQQIADANPTVYNGSMPKGLVNNNTMCYLNAYIQALFHIPVFRDTIAKADDRTPVIDALQWIFQGLENARPRVSAVRVQSALKWRVKPGEQADLNEFMSKLLNAVPTRVSAAFSGTSLMKTNTSTQADRFKSLHLHPGAADVELVSLPDLLTKYFAEEVIEKNKTHQKIPIEFPTIIQLQIQRHQVEEIPDNGEEEEEADERKGNRLIDIKSIIPVRIDTELYMEEFRPSPEMQLQYEQVKKSAARSIQVFGSANSGSIVPFESPFEADDDDADDDQVADEEPMPRRSRKRAAPSRSKIVMTREDQKDPVVRFLVNEWIQFRDRKERTNPAVKKQLRMWIEQERARIEYKYDEEEED